MGRRTVALGFVVGTLALFAVGCTAGDPQFTADDPAGFWMGLWHGIISVITLIIGIFSDSIGVYEAHNSGGWYDFGFLMGVICVWGGGSTTYHRTTHRSRDQQEWDELGRKVERKIRRKIREWAEADPDEDWNVVEAKAEAKLKRNLRKWAEED